MHFKRLTTKEEVRALMQSLPPSVAIDTEYDGKDSRTAKLLTVVISPDGESSYSIPADMLYYLDSLSWCKELRLQNFKADYEILSNHGLDLYAVPCVDTMLLDHLVDENMEHGLDAMVQRYFQDNYKEVFWKKYKNYTDATPEDALAYECKDAIYTYRLTDILREKLAGREALIEHVHRLAKSLYLTEVQGLPIDFDLMLATEKEMSGKINNLLPRMREEYLTGCQTWEMKTWVEHTQKARDKLKTEKGKANCRIPKPKFNFGSDKQLAWLLYEDLSFPVLKRTKRTDKGGGGNPSVDYETIELLKKEGHDLGSIGEYKEIKNLYATFVVGLIERVENGRIFPAFNVNGTTTGRISHSNPNMGNMPKDGPFRNFFLPSPDHRIFGADYSQLEVVIEANLTNDPNLTRITVEGASKHDITAQALGIPRDIAKTVNFALGYHCGVNKLQKLLACSYKEAQYQYNKYWEAYAGVKGLKDLTDAEVEAGLPIKNIFGRVRHFPFKFEKPWQAEAAKRQAYNFKIQGPGGDCMNRSFYLTSEEMQGNGWGKMLFTVHDEGVGEAVVNRVEDAKLLLIKHMEGLTQYLNFKIPLKAVGYGPLDKWSKA